MLNIFETGPIRPPSEANSLLLRVSRNCTWNRCKFCSLYKGKHFETRTVEELIADIDAMYEYKNIIMQNNESNIFDRNRIQQQYEKLSEPQKHCYYMIYNWINHGMESVFLQDANSIVIKTEKLVQVLKYLRVKFPEIKRITTYARADILSKLSEDDFKMLAEAGLNRIHSGYESGSDKVLQIVNKGITKKQQIEGGLKVKNAGIELSIYYMPGLGGKDLLEEHATETADVINAVNPNFVRIRTFVVMKKSELYESFATGQLVETTDEEKVYEIKKMIMNLNDKITCSIKSDHIVNLLETIDGVMPQDKQRLIDIIEEFENLQYDEKLAYQLARRMGLVREVADMKRVSKDNIQQIKQVISEVKNPLEFESILRNFLRKYI